jgi:hypothetical protein
LEPQVCILQNFSLADLLKKIYELKKFFLKFQIIFPTIIGLMTATTKSIKKLLATNTKLEKGEGFQWTTRGLSLAPANISGKQLCPHRSPGCELACLNLSGMGVFSNVQEARLNKSKFLIEDRPTFIAQLNKELQSLNKKALKGEQIAVRLNVLSDLPWHNMIKMSDFPNIKFYDYTPNMGRMIQFLRGELPENYHLTFSRKENNQAKVELVSSMGGNVAVVFDKLPQTYLGKPVVDGDKSDLRFLDPRGVIVGLLAKGKGKQDQTGFVIHI